MFNLLDPVTIADVKDGTSNVIMLGEVTNRSFCCGQQWKGKSGRPRIGTGEPVYRSLLVATAPWTNTHVWIDAPAGPGPLLRADGMPGALWGNWNNPHVMAPLYYAHYSQNVEWPGASSSHGGGGNFAMCDGSVRTISPAIATGGGSAGPIGDAYGRYGNVWSAIHFIQGIPDKSMPNF